MPRDTDNVSPDGTRGIKQTPYEDDGNTISEAEGPAPTFKRDPQYARSGTARQRGWNGEGGM